jgi:hypothetical protein
MNVLDNGAADKAGRPVTDYDPDDISARLRRQKAQEEAALEEMMDRFDGMPAHMLVECCTPGACGPDEKTWLVDGILARWQPGALGGPLKTLKTLVASDLAVSVATGTPFLGTYPLVCKGTVLFFSAEVGEYALAERAEVQAAARGIELHDVETGLFFFARMPDFSDKDNLKTLGLWVKRRKPVLVILDPLYRCFGPGAVQPTNLFAMGSALGRIADVCLEGGATPVFVHHSNRELQPGQPMQLQDLLFSGLAEFTRQWLLLSWRKPFDPATQGRHELWLNYGGSMGHCGLKVLRVNEGTLGNRKWETEVMDVPTGQVEKRSARRQGTSKVRQIVLEAVRKLGVGSKEIARQVLQQHLPGVSGKVLTTALEGLSREGVVRVEERAFTGRRGKDRVRHVVFLLPAGAIKNDS